MELSVDHPPDLLRQLQVARAAIEQIGQLDQAPALISLINHVELSEPSLMQRLEHMAEKYPVYALLIVVAPLWVGGWLLLFVFRPLMFQAAARWAKDAGSLSLGEYKLPLPLHWFVLGGIATPSMGFGCLGDSAP